jgi:bifunctional non-homologous end joining protein LigD
MLPYLDGRAVTLHRFPDGVGANGFFEKHCPDHRPEWVRTAHLPSRDGGVDFCRIDSAAALVWTMQLAAIELHVPMASADDPWNPLALVFDLDPGAPADQGDCGWAAIRLREVLGALGLQGFPKLSGGKGLHVYVPLNCGPGTPGGGAPHDADHGAEVALAVAERLTQLHPERIVRNIRKDRRKGKVLVDWSQNRPSKTTVAPYAVRARERPTTSAPITWEEVAAIAAGQPMHIELAEARSRVDRFGDLFAPVRTMVQRLPPRPRT